MYVTVYRRDRAAEKKKAAEEAAKAEIKVETTAPAKKGRPKRRNKK